MILLLFLLFAYLAIVLLSGDWRQGFLVTIVIGFAQDPIRKLTPGQPGLYVGLVLIAFLASTFVLYLRKGSSFNLASIFWSFPSLQRWLLLFVWLVFIQAVHSFVRWNIPLRSLIGIGFYLTPLLAIWVGFQIGLDQRFQRRLWILYLILSLVFGATAYLDYSGVNIPLFDAVGDALIIHFRKGFYTTGAIGLWRSTDIAAIHLTISACLSIVFAATCSKPLSRNLWITAAVIFSMVSLLTGRRKAIVQIVVFTGLFLFMLARYGGRKGINQIYGILISAIGLSSIIFLVGPTEIFGEDFSEYINRAGSASTELGTRFNILGIIAIERALRISEFFGVGAGTLAQTGASGIASVDGRDFVYVSESGAGKIVAELGVPGLLILLIIIIGLAILIRRALHFLPYLPPSVSHFEIGLLCFAASNIPFFSAAAGVYGDPFVLIMCANAFGSFLAVPWLVPINRLSTGSANEINRGSVKMLG